FLFYIILFEECIILEHSITFSNRNTIEKFNFINNIIHLINNYLYNVIKVNHLNGGFKMVYQVDGKTIVLVLEQGEDIVDAVTDIAREQNGKFGTVRGVGVCDDEDMNFYNTNLNHKLEINSPFRIIILFVNNYHIDEKPFSHLHATFDSDTYETLSGHI